MGQSKDSQSPDLQSRSELAVELAIHRSELEIQNIELREAQQRLELSRARYFSLFDLSPVPYLVVRDNLVISEANMAAAELMGIDRQRLVGSLVYNFAIDGEREAWQSRLTSAFSQIRCQPFDSVLRTSAGAQRHVHFSIQLLNDEADLSSKLLLVAITDVTGRVEAERERQQLNQKLLETQKLESLGVLAGGVAHDFNNLLTGILTAASLLKEELRDQPRALSLAEHIENASQRTADLCKQLLTYAGKGRMTMEALRLNPLVSDLLALISASLSKKHRLVNQPSTYVPAVSGDATQLRQILMNLVVNASEAIGDRDGEVRIRTGVDRIVPRALSGLVTGMECPPGEYAYLEVEDDGCGMSAGTMARIFDPFFTTKFTGRGLGLAAVIGIVRSHRGALSVRSQPGQGSCFRLWLPVADTPVAAGYGDDRTPAPIRRSLEGARILVVDDEPIVRRALAHVLNRLGCHTALEESGAEAIKSLTNAKERPDVILLDITMPGWDGPQTFLAAREAGYTGPIFFMSGYAADDISNRLAHLDAAGFLQKPIVVKDLLTKIGGLLIGRLDEPAGAAQSFSGDRNKPIVDGS